MTDDRRLVSMKRAVIAELLDTDCGTPAEVAASLRDLRRINRWFGGVATTEDLVWRVARQIGSSSLSLLEVAAGSGYVPQTAGERLLHRGLRKSLHDRAASDQLSFEQWRFGCGR
jgi:hypothetical protein